MATKAALTLLSIVPSVHYAAQSKIFAEDPRHLFVTGRGDDGAPTAKSTTNAQLAVYDVATDPTAPKLMESWAPDDGRKAVEGLDRCGDLLAVVGISDGTLYTLNASCVSCGALGSLKLSTSRALHVRLAFVPDGGAGTVPWGGCGGGRRGRVFALVTSGFAMHQSMHGVFADALMAVDVTDPAAMREVARLDGLPSTPEGIFVHGSFGYVGGCKGAGLAVVDLSGLGSATEPRLGLNATLHDSDFVQLVSTQRGYDDAPSTLYFALWGSPKGGLLTARAAEGGGRPQVLAKLVTSELAKANRAAIHEARQLVALPLEQTHARLALVDVSNASAPRLAAPVTTLPATLNGTTPVAATTYCAAFDSSGRYLYAFAAQTNAMYVYALACT